MNRKFIISIVFLLLSVLCTAFLSNHAILVSIILLLTAFAKHKVYPIKRELLWFVLLCFGGAIVEIILVNLSRAWSYSNPQFLGIPVWIPFFWGTIGTTIIVVYEGFINK